MFHMSTEQRDEYQAAKKRIRRVNDYVVVTPEMSIKIGRLQSFAWSTFEEKGDSAIFTTCAEFIENKLLTQTY